MVEKIVFASPAHKPDLPNPKDFLEREEFERILSFNYQKQKYLRHGDFKTREQKWGAKAQFVKMGVLQVIEDLEVQVKNDQTIIRRALRERFSKLQTLCLEGCEFTSKEARKVEGFFFIYFLRLKDVYMPRCIPLVIAPLD